MNVTFPPRIELIQDDKERASARLRYMVLTISDFAYDQRVGGIKRLAADIGYDHSTLCNAMARGSMSGEMAIRLEDFIKERNLGLNLQSRHFIRPLEV